MFAGIKLIGEGQDREEKDIPIDIHLTKLLEWMVDRKKVPRTWKKEIYPLQKRIAELRKRIAGDESLSNQPKVQEILDKDGLIGFDCNSLLSVFNASDQASTNFFGQYNSAILRELDSIVSAYSKNNLSLAEAANLLVVNAKYEIPSRRKKIHQINGQINELARKEKETTSLADDYSRKYYQECAALGIEGNDVVSELQGLVQKLPEYFTEAAALIQDDNVLQALRFYRKFSSLIMFAGKSVCLDASELEETICPLLHFVIHYGNDYEAIYLRTQDPQVTDEELSLLRNRISSSLQAVESESPAAADEKTADTVNWGSNIDVNPQPSDNLEVGAIDWDITVEPSDQITIESQVDHSEDINWDIEVNEEGMEFGAIESRSSDDTQNNQRVLAMKQYRRGVINDLHELYAFYSQRLAECTTKHNHEMLLSSLIGASASGAQIRDIAEDVDTLRRLRTAVEGVLSYFEQDQLKQAISIQTSSRYLQRLAANVKHKSDTSLRLKVNVENMKTKRAQLQIERSNLADELNSLVAETRHVQQQVEQGISALYDGRKVNIMGDLNAL